MAKRKTTDEGPIERIDKLSRLIAGAEARIKSKRQPAGDDAMDRSKIEKWQREMDQLTGGGKKKK